MKARTATAVVILATPALTGCAVGPDYKRPAPLAPPAWRTPTDGVGSVAGLRSTKTRTCGLTQGEKRTP